MGWQVQNDDCPVIRNHVARCVAAASFITGHLGNTPVVIEFDLVFNRAGSFQLIAVVY